MENGKNGQPKVIAMASGPPSSKEHALLRWPAPGRPCHGVITQWPMHQLVIHWTPTGTMLCKVPLAERCELCEQHLKRRWLGFVGAYDPAAGRHVVLEITAGAACALPDLLDVGRSLVGHRLSTFRLGKSKTSRVSAVLEPPIPGAVIPKPIDYATVICRLFGLESLPWGVMPMFGEGGAK